MVYVAVFWLLLNDFALFRSLEVGSKKLLAQGAEIAGYGSASEPLKILFILIGKYITTACELYRLGHIGCNFARSVTGKVTFSF